ncbi:protein rep, partial [Escherichia coli]|nr:protein rep [Escherichia coli]MCI3092709.1 protein rep [Escherichia coli]
HLVRAAPRHPANVSHSQIEICQRSPFPDSSNRKSRGPAPPAWFLELARQTYGLRMIATGGRFREILQVEKPETDEDLIGA